MREIEQKAWYDLGQVIEGYSTSVGAAYQQRISHVCYFKRSKVNVIL